MPPLPPPSTRRHSLLALPLLLAGRPLLAQAGEPVRLPRHVRMPDPQLLYVRRIVGLPLVRGSELAQWAQAGSLKRKLPCQVDSRLLESAAGGCGQKLGLNMPRCQSADGAGQDCESPVSS